EVASEFFETLAGKTVVLMGAGEMGRETLRYLVDAGADDVRIVNRSRARAEAIAAEFGGRAMDWDELDAALVDADVLVGTTSATTPVITRERFARVQQQRYDRVLL